MGNVSSSNNKVDVPIRDSTSSVGTSSSPSILSTDKTDIASDQDTKVASPKESACPMKRKNGSLTQNNEGACPVKSYKHPHVYNVYSQKLDPSNNMPAIPNQQDAPSQSETLSKERVPSTIPKAGTDNQTWVYPSPQMFWNALVRKQKTEGASESDMNTVISIHNNMNETTWRQVLAWEALHPVSNDDLKPKLLRFLGRPFDLSPKARLKTWIGGHIAPFDRHDWIVDRGGKEVRYVIDYYHDESAVDIDQTPKHLKDIQSMKSIKVDVRPALDSLESIWDRLVKMPLEQYKQERTPSSSSSSSRDEVVRYDPPPFFPSKKMVIAQVEESKARVRIQEQWQEITSRCHGHKEKLRACSSEDECRAASVVLQKCTASVVCPSIVAAFDASIKVASNATQIESCYSDMTKCLQDFETDSRKNL